MNCIKDVLRWEEIRRQSRKKPHLKHEAFMKRLLLDRIALDNRVVHLERRERYFRSLGTKPRRSQKVKV